MQTLHAARAPFSSLAELRMWDDGYPATAVQLSMADGTPATGDLATSVVCYWNDMALFALFEAHFHSLRTVAPPLVKGGLGKTLHLWEQSDVLELFIGLRARSLLTYSEFQVAPDGRWLDSKVWVDQGMILLDTTWESGLLVSSAVDGGRHLWRAALEIPWHALGTNDPSRCHWDVNFYRATGRFHGDELLAWSPTGYGEGCFHRPERFGVLELV